MVPGKTIGQLIRNQNGMKQGNVPKKAVVIKPPGVQLCNRLRNLMAGVILAMLTGTAPATSTTLLYRVPDWWYCLLCSLVLVVHPLQPECPMSSTKLHICYTMSGFDPGHVGSDRAVQYSFKRGYYAGLSPAIAFDLALYSSMSAWTCIATDRVFFACRLLGCYRL